MSPKENIEVANSFEEVVFSKRNKEYGAYFLRRRYKRHVIAAFFLSFFMVGSAVVVPLINSYNNKNRHHDGLDKIVTLKLENIVDPTVPPPPPPPPAELAPLARFVAPVVVDSVREEFAFATIDESIESAVVGDLPTEITATVIKDDVIEEPEQGFVSVTEPSQFQGGDLNTFNVWVAQNIKYPQLAVENGISGKVYVQFAVNSKGNLVDAKVLRGVDAALDQEAIRVIQSSPKWTAPKQNGRPVKQLFTLPVTFKLQE